MQAGSLGLVATILVVLALSIVLAITLAAPIFAISIFIVAFGVFLLWRGKRRSEARLGRGYENRVTTKEATADPVADSSVPDVARTASDAHTRHEPA